MTCRDGNGKAEIERIERCGTIADWMTRAMTTTTAIGMVTVDTFRAQRVALSARLLKQKDVWRIER